MALTGFGCPFLFLISSLRNRSGDRLPTFPASGHVASAIIAAACHQLSPGEIPGLFLLLDGYILAILGSHDHPALVLSASRIGSRYDGSGVLHGDSSWRDLFHLAVRPLGELRRLRNDQDLRRRSEAESLSEVFVRGWMPIGTSSAGCFEGLWHVLITSVCFVGSRRCS